MAKRYYLWAATHRGSSQGDCLSDLFAPEHADGRMWQVILGSDDYSVINKARNASLLAYVEIRVVDVDCPEGKRIP